MKRILRIIWSSIRCQCYLIFKGGWKGELEFKGYDNKNHLMLIAIVDGKTFDIFRWKESIKKVFYIDKSTQNEKKSNH